MERISKNIKQETVGIYFYTAMEDVQGATKTKGSGIWHTSNVFSFSGVTVVSCYNRKQQRENPKSNICRQ